MRLVANARSRLRSGRTNAATVRSGFWRFSRQCYLVGTVTSPLPAGPSQGSGLPILTHDELASSLDHLVSAGEQRRRHVKAKRLRGVEVDHQLVLGRRLHRKVGRLLALKDTIDIAGRA